MKQKIQSGKGIQTEINIPGDKSISHRSIIFSSLARGKSEIKGFLECEDCLNTISAFRSLGINIEKIGSGNYIVEGKGINGLNKPKDVINCGNSGTTMRLMTGLLSAQPFYSVLTGDNSLCERPMDRVIIPLEKMGARIWSRDNKYAPLGIRGNDNLKGIEYHSPVASAQVKSSLLLAGLYAEGETFVNEPEKSRDHTERMLKAMGANITIKDNTVSVSQFKDIGLESRLIRVPADISSAAFFMAAGLLLPDSEIYLKNIGINPTRAGIIEIIKKMGGHIQLENKRNISGEMIADVLVKSSELRGIEVKGDIIPRLIDEIPIITVLGAFARGRTIIKDAEELRVKETDRIKALYEEFKKIGVEIKEREDGLIIEGNNLIKGGVNVDSRGDHRIAMSLAVAGLLAENEIIIDNCQAVNVSFPGFFELIKMFSK